MSRTDIDCSEQYVDLKSAYKREQILGMTWSTQWGLTYSPLKILSVIPYLKKQCNNNPFLFTKLYFSENMEILEPLIW